MSLYSAHEFVLPLPAHHRFPMAKYHHLHQRVSAHFPNREILRPPAALDRQLLRVHAPRYVRAVVSGELTAKEIRRIGFPWSQALVERSRRSVGATIAACRDALRGEVGVNLAGGTHHAGHAHGSGFCVFNDVAVAARAMQAEDRAHCILVIDLDVHQGDGTAEIFTADPTVFTFSMHGAANFPFRKRISDLDIGLPTGTGDTAYLSALDKALSQIFDVFHADLAIYLAGVDVFVDDTLGQLALTAEGIARRDALVYARCRTHGVPVATVMGGGYAKDVEQVADLHAQTIIAAHEADLDRTYESCNSTIERGTESPES